jgi:branched-subunit amino acid ABC-type transport system permease component
MRIVNMAHGTFYAVGAFVTAWLIKPAATSGVDTSCRVFATGTAVRF